MQRLYASVSFGVCMTHNGQIMTLLSFQSVSVQVQIRVPSLHSPFCAQWTWPDRSKCINQTVRRQNGSTQSNVDFHPFIMIMYFPMTFLASHFHVHVRQLPIYYYNRDAFNPIQCTDLAHVWLWFFSVYPVIRYSIYFSFESSYNNSCTKIEVEVSIQIQPI